MPEFMSLTTAASTAPEVVVTTPLEELIVTTPSIMEVVSESQPPVTSELRTDSFDLLPAFNDVSFLVLCIFSLSFLSYVLFLISYYFFCSYFCFCFFFSCLIALPNRGIG